MQSDLKKCVLIRRCQFRAGTMWVTARRLVMGSDNVYLANSNADFAGNYRTEKPGNGEPKIRNDDSHHFSFSVLGFPVSRFALTNDASGKSNVFLTETQLIVVLSRFASVANPRTSPQTHHRTYPARRASVTVALFARAATSVRISSLHNRLCLRRQGSRLCHCHRLWKANFAEISAFVARRT